MPVVKRIAVLCQRDRLGETENVVWIDRGLDLCKPGKIVAKVLGFPLRTSERRIDIIWIYDASMGE